MSFRRLAFKTTTRPDAEPPPAPEPEEPPPEPEPPFIVEGREAKKARKVHTRGAVMPVPGFRTTLYRRWGTAAEPMGIFIGLNPGKANDKIDDATARKYVGFAERWGWGSYMAFNLFEYVATNPKDLIARLLAGDKVQAGDDAHLCAALAAGPHLQVCFAWGNPPPKVFARWLERVRVIRTMVHVAGIKPLCAAVTQEGWPTHLSRLGYTAAPIPWVSQW